MSSGKSADFSRNNALSINASTAQYRIVQRDSNLELFRILLMFVIIAHHYVVSSGLLTECVFPEPISGRSLFLRLFGAWEKTGINGFLMITGYFMCKSHISFRKYLKILLEIEFYQIVIFIIFVLTGDTTFTIKAFVKALLPIQKITNGFVSCFLIFFLFIPFLNMFISNLTEKNYQLLLAFLLFFFTILPSCFIQINFNYVTWFSIVYLIAAYIRCYPYRLFSSGRLWGGVLLCCIVLSCISVVTLAFVFPQKSYHFLEDSNKILALTTAVSGFLFFKNLKIPYSKFINTVATSVFGVLLIHISSDTMLSWLWRKNLRCTDFFDSSYLVLHAVLSVIGIYVICTVIDQIRIRLLENPFFLHFGPTIDELQEKFLSLTNKLPSIQSSQTVESEKNDKC